MQLEDWIQPAILCAVSVIGWGVRSLLAKVNERDTKLDKLRTDTHEELKEYVRHEVCRAYREAMRDNGHCSGHQPGGE